MSCLIAARPSGGRAASLAASASTSASSASSSTHFQMSPQSAAFSAGSGSAVSARPSARAWPTRRGRCQLPPLSGMRPRLAKLWMNLAERPATTRSQASAMLAPAPAATPLTRAMTGWSRLARRRTSGFQLASHRLAEIDRLARRHRAVVEILPCAEAAARAGQDDNARAFAALSSASRNSPCIAAVKLLRRSGRLSVIRATPSPSARGRSLAHWTCSTSPSPSSGRAAAISDWHCLRRRHIPRSVRHQRIEVARLLEQPPHRRGHFLHAIGKAALGLQGDHVVADLGRHGRGGAAIDGTHERTPT